MPQQDVAPLDAGAMRSAPQAPEAQLLQAALDGMHAHVCLLDSQAIIVWVNQAWQAFAAANGALPEQVGVGTNYLAVCDRSAAMEPHACEFADGLREVLQGRSARFEIEYPCHSPTEPRWFVVTATRITWAEQVGAVITHQPITARKLAEMRQREVQKLEALGTLASGIAHDFNNILSVILANAALLSDGLAPDGDGNLQLHRLRQAAERARELVQQILTFGRQQPHQSRRQPLAPLVVETLAMLRATVPASASLEPLALDNTAHAVIDRVEFEQVLINLCTNAWHALGERPGRVRIGLQQLAAGSPLAARARLDPTRRHVHLWVQDTGVGMDEKTRLRIFDPFFTTKAAGQGTGLGLAVVHGILRRQGGDVVVDSAPGMGSTFHVLLPAAMDQALVAAGAKAATGDSADGPVAPVWAGDPAATAPADVARGASVLMVDDDEVVGITTEALLKRQGMVVTRCSDPRDALQQLYASPGHWHILLTDLSMPEMTGLDLAAAALARLPNLRVVVLSGYIADSQRAQAERIGVSALVRKERVMEDLLGSLRDVLAARAVRAP